METTSSRIRQDSSDAKIECVTGWHGRQLNETRVLFLRSEKMQHVGDSPKLMAASLCLMRKQLISFFAFSLYKNYSSEIIPAVTCLLKYFMRIVNSDYVKYS